MRVAFDVQLRGEQLAVCELHLEMNMRRAPGVRRRPDRVEAPGAGLVGDNAAEALEGRIGAASVPRVVVVARSVALPDLDLGAGERLALQVRHRAFDPRGLALGVLQ